jgi:ABC-type glycerol-3-phosphate transport system substrate-binding protein
MAKKLIVVLALVLMVTGAFAAKKSNQVSATASGSVQVNQLTYSVGSSVPIDYSYAGLPVGSNNFLLVQTVCWGAWNGVQFDPSTEYLQSDTVSYSSSSGTGVDTVTIPDTYQGSGSCTVSLYVMFTVANTKYSKTLATSTFTVAMP